MTSARRHSDALLEISQALSNELETNNVLDRILKVAKVRSFEERSDELGMGGLRE